MFTLMDGDAQQAIQPILPAMKKCRELRLGQYVKLGFQEAGDTEKAWVEVKSIDGDKLTGVVDNDLVLMTSVKDGDEVSFRLKHILAIYHGE